MLFLGFMLLLCVPAAAEQPSMPTSATTPPAINEGGRVDNPPAELDLTYKFQDGQINRYQVQIMSGGSYLLLNQKQEQKFETVTEMYFVQSIKFAGDGLYKVGCALLSGVVRIPGFGQSTITLPEMTYTMDERGSVKKVSGLEKLSLLPGKPEQKSLALTLGQLSFQGFPKKALKIGDEWTRDYNVAINEDAKFAVKTTSKLIGYEKCDSYDCAKIETSYEYPIAFELADKVQGKLKLEGKESGAIITRFAFLEGKMIRSEGDIKTDAKVTKADGSGSAYVKLQLNVVSRLLPPQPAAKKEGY